MSQSLSTIQPPPRLLFGPGPTMVDPRVYDAMGKPIVGLMDPYFFSINEEIRTGLQSVFGTNNPMTLAISGTGSAGMEAAVSNFVEPGSTMAVLANGFFSDRLSEMGRRYGANVVRLEKPWGEVFSDEEVTAFISQHRPNTVAYVTAETSTGAFQPGKAIAAAAHEAGALVIADCVTSLGGMPVDVDATGIDIAYSCTQKGLSCPPGLAPFTVSSRAMSWLRERTSPGRSWYLDLLLLEEYYYGSHKYHHTISVPLFYALHEGLARVAEEGADARFARHQRHHKAFVAGIEGMGLSFHVPAAHRIWHLNTVRVPEGVNDLAVRQRLIREHGIEILGGFGPLAGKVFRIGIMGPLAEEKHLLQFLEAFENALSAEGFVPAGRGTESARRSYEESTVMTGAQ